jgi:hypothetical protein
MKKIMCTLALLANLFLSTSCIAGSTKDIVNENREVAPFHSIAIESVGSIHFTQADHYSLRLEGKPELVKLLTNEVNNGTLCIDKERQEPERKHQTGYLHHCPRFETSGF